MNGKSKAREAIMEIRDLLVEEEICMTRLEALRLLQEEVSCMEAEEKALVLLLRGWGENLDLGLIKRDPVSTLSKVFLIFSFSVMLN